MIDPYLVISSENDTQIDKSTRLMKILPVDDPPPSLISSENDVLTVQAHLYSLWSPPNVTSFFVF